MASTEDKPVNNLDNQFDNFSPTDKSKAWLEAILKKNSRDEEVTKIVNYKSAKATVKGDNYASDLTRVTMDVITGNGKLKKMSVIIKELPATEYRRAYIDEMGIFLRETVMYCEILPKMVDIMREFEDYSEIFWSKCYDYRSYDRLVLQDITKLGYKMSDRRLGLDFEHCRLVVMHMAKFHALSVIAKSRHLIPMEIFSSGILQQKKMQLQLGEMYKKMLENLVQDIQEKWEPNWKPVAERISALIPNVMDIVVSALERDDERFNVLNHGDCWLNNFMFKYGLNDNPIGVKFVDFQLCMYNTPAYDLIYFLSTTPNYLVRCKYISTLVEDYHKTLVHFLKLYDYKGDIMTMEALQEELNRLSLLAVINGLLLLPLFFNDKAEMTPDMEEMIKDHVENNSLNLDWLPRGLDNVNKCLKLLVKNAVDAKTL